MDLEEGGLGMDVVLGTAHIDEPRTPTVSDSSNSRSFLHRMCQKSALLARIGALFAIVSLALPNLAWAGPFGFEWGMKKEDVIGFSVRKH